MKDVIGVSQLAAVGIVSYLSRWALLLLSPAWRCHIS